MPLSGSSVDLTQSRKESVNLNLVQCKLAKLKHKRKKSEKSKMEQPQIPYSAKHYLFIFAFSGPHSRPMEVPRLGVELELQLLAYTTATATQPCLRPQLLATPDPPSTERGQGSNLLPLGY